MPAAKAYTRQGAHFSFESITIDIATGTAPVMLVISNRYLNPTMHVRPLMVWLLSKTVERL